MLVLQDISIKRGGRLVLCDLTAQFAPGSLTVLRAPNGGGKTTLLRCIAGLIPLHKGQIDYSDTEVVFAGHQDAVKSAMTVAELLRFWEAIYGTPCPPDLINQLGLADLIDTPAGLLSAGQKRRLGLARSFISPAKIKLFDEPTTALDRDHRALFYDLIDQHISSGGLALLSSHDDTIPETAEVFDLTPFAASNAADHDDPFLTEAFE